MLGRLSELMFVEAVRTHLDSLPSEQTGWLAGLRDCHVGGALSLMHGNPAHPWTIEELAREVGLSRSKQKNQRHARSRHPRRRTRPVRCLRMNIQGFWNTGPTSRPEGRCRGCSSGHTTFNGVAPALKRRRNANHVDCALEREELR